MKLKIYQVDAFAANVFKGNPAAVCPLDEWLDESTMQKIAAENNLSETAFFVKTGDDYDIRWFTPTVEIDLCGHATLASAFVMFEFYNYKEEKIVFHCNVGRLEVRKNGALLELNFPSNPPAEVPEPHGLAEAMGQRPTTVLKARDYVAVYKDEETIRNLKPDFLALKKLDATGVIATAPGKNVDFVSRFFAPNMGIDEDPVTGAAHTTLIPYWSGILNKTKMEALQVSARGGELLCELRGERVSISGKATAYLVGEIFI